MRRFSSTLKPPHRGRGPAEAVRAYHDALEKSAVRPIRALDEDLEISEDVLR